MIIDFHVHTFPAEIRDHRERFFDDGEFVPFERRDPKDRAAGLLTGTGSLPWAHVIVHDPH